MRTFALALALLGLTATFAPAQAQGAFMPYLGYNLDSENALVGVGARFAFPLDVPISLTAQPAIEYQFEGTDDVTILQADLNAIVQLNAASVAPYVGAGLAVGYVDVAGTSDTDLGLNVLGGALFNPTGFGQPFAQARYTIADGPDALTIIGGVALGF
jgi:opacity protein-like surface antigen